MECSVARYVLDPKEIGRLKTEQLHEEFFLPIMDAEYLSFTSRLFNSFEAAIHREDASISDVFLADYRFLLILVRYICAEISHGRCVEAGISLVASNILPSGVSTDWDTHGRWIREHLDEQTRLKARLRDAYYTGVNYVRLSKIQKKPLRIDRFSSSMGLLWKIKEDYILKSASYRLQHEPGFYFPRTLNKKATNRKSQWQPVIDKVFEAILIQFPDLDNVLALEPLVGAWCERLEDIAYLYHCVRGSKRKPRSLLVSGGTNPYRKIVALGLQREGVQVRTFHHGNDLGARIARHAHRGGVSHCTEFYCPTEHVCATYRRNYSSGLTEQRYGTRYIGVYEEGNPGGLPYLKRSHRRRTSDKETVMVLGRPLNYSRVVDHYFSDFIQKVDFDRRLLEMLSSMGYEVVYKPHPEWGEIAKLMFTSSPASLIFGAFEATWEIADVCVFSSAVSTTFGFVLSTDMPVVLFDPKGNQWDYQMRELVDSRCAVIPFEIDSQGRGMIPDWSLRSAIRDSKEKRTDRTLYNTVILQQ